MRRVAVIFCVSMIWSASVSGKDRLPTRTLNELLLRSDAVVIGERKTVVETITSGGTVNVPFTVIEPIKNHPQIDHDAVISASCLPGDLKDDRFLLLYSRNRSGKMKWKVSISVSDKVAQHLTVLSKADFEEVERLKFFYSFLEHSESTIAGNADLEFLLASDESFAAFCKQVDAVEICDRLSQKDLPIHRCRLYLAMLARCGGESDADWIEQLLTSNEWVTGTLDAYLAAYVALKGEPGLKLLDERFLSDENADLASTYSAVLALRFASDHPEFGISIQRLQQSHRLILNHPLLTDIAIFHLARIEDWSSIKRIVEVGKNSHDRATQIATINFLRRCPDENARRHLDEIARQHPDAFHRAVTFFPDSVLKTTNKHRPASIRWTERPAGC